MKKSKQNIYLLVIISFSIFFFIIVGNYDISMSQNSAQAQEMAGMGVLANAVNYKYLMNSSLDIAGDPEGYFPTHGCYVVRSDKVTGRNWIERWASYEADKKYGWYISTLLEDGSGWSLPKDGYPYRIDVADAPFTDVWENYIFTVTTTGKVWRLSPSPIGSEYVDMTSNLATVNGASDVGIGPTGFAVALSRDGYKIFYLKDYFIPQWAEITGLAYIGKMVNVDVTQKADGTVSSWVTTSTGNIYEMKVEGNQAKWINRTKSMRARDIGACPFKGDNGVYIVAGKYNWGNSIYRWNTASQIWELVSTGLSSARLSVTCDENGNVNPCPLTTASKAYIAQVATPALAQWSYVCRNASNDIACSA